MKTLGSPIVESLPDVAADLFSFAVQIRSAGDPGDPEAFMLKVDDLFRTYETRARQLETPDTSIQLAKYALSAFIDEMILSSNWTLLDMWRSNPLQLRYFNDFNAGEEFFNKLESIRETEDPKKLEVVEVFYTCLSLGFRGKYADLAGMEKIKSLMEGMARNIKKARSKGAEGLSPSWKAPDQAQPLAESLPAWAITVVCGGILLILYITLAWLLGNTLSDVERTINKP